MDVKYIQNEDNHMNKYLEEILEKMCKIVKVDYKDIDFESKDWYLKHEWTPKQEDEYKKWLFKYLKNNREARNELMEYPSKTKRDLNKFIDNFVFNYGWKYKKPID